MYSWCSYAKNVAWLFYYGDHYIRGELTSTTVNSQMHKSSHQKRALQMFSFIFNPGQRLKDKIAATRSHILSMLPHPIQQTFCLYPALVVHWVLYLHLSHTFQLSCLWYDSHDLECNLMLSCQKVLNLTSTSDEAQLLNSVICISVQFLSRYLFHMTAVFRCWIT